MLSYLLVAGLTAVITSSRAQSIGQAQVVYKWNLVDLEWSSKAEKNEALRNKTFVPERNLVVGLKVHNDDVYVTVPRWFFPSGVPVTLAKVVQVNNTAVLRPYPNWAYQNQNVCDSFQCVMGMEIDPNTGYMYVIDTGRVWHTLNNLNLCPAKLYIFDLNTNKLIEKYELPHEVVNRTTNFISDIVLDYINGKVRFAYMSDPYDSKIIIYDFEKRASSYIKHPSMDIVKNESIITINNKPYDFLLPNVKGIAMSPDFQFVYYCPVSGFDLFQIPTSSLRNVTSPRTDGIRRVGRKISASGGIGYGMKNLYYGALGLNAVYYWNPTQDAINQSVGVDRVTLETQNLLVRNDITMQWPDILAFDNKGYLWFTSDRLGKYLQKDISFTTFNDEAFVRVWKVYVGENGYLYQTDARTMNSAITQSPITGAVFVLSCLLSVFRFW